MRSIFLLLLFSYTTVLAQQKSLGKVLDENGNPLAGVMVINISTNIASYTSNSGEFAILTKPQDELRFVKSGFERTSKRVSGDLDEFLSVHLLQSPYDIEEVKVKPQLTGDIEKDSKLLSKEDKVARLQKDIGLPPPPEKPRERPAEVANDVLLPLVFGQMKVQAIYDLLSGEAKRKKNLYRYEDFQENIQWIRKRVDDEYFIKMGIPKNRINEFLSFSIKQNPEILKMVKAKNLSKILVLMEDSFLIFSKRLISTEKS